MSKGNPGEIVLNERLDRYASAARLKKEATKTVEVTLGAFSCLRYRECPTGREIWASA